MGSYASLNSFDGFDCFLCQVLHLKQQIDKLTAENGKCSKELETVTDSLIAREKEIVALRELLGKAKISAPPSDSFK